MARLVGFFLLVLVVLSLLRSVPGVGRWLGGFWGFWLVAIGLGVGLGWLSGALTRRQRLSGELRQLGEVDSPHNRGKLGSLLLASGRAARAIPHLESAAQGEPEVAEWHYRLGAARCAVGRAGEARGALEAAARIDPEHAYGGVQLALSGARLEGGDAAGALEALDTFDRNHGASPESSYRRGLALRRLGRRDEARQCFERVGQLAGRAARFQRAQNRPWVWRALLRRLLA
jgi:tetratricopeptide (TPR) repeat protein